jgi:hypothetical protein
VVVVVVLGEERRRRYMGPREYGNTISAFICIACVRAYIRSQKQIYMHARTHARMHALLSDMTGTHQAAVGIRC